MGQAMILKRVSPKLWVGRAHFDGDLTATLVMTHYMTGSFRVSLAFITKGKDPSKSPVFKNEGLVHELLTWSQQTIKDQTGITVPIIKQEIPWETITQELSESQAAD
jgi:hypothetical protein